MVCCCTLCERSGNWIYDVFGCRCMWRIITLVISQSFRCNWISALIALLSHHLSSLGSVERISLGESLDGLLCCVVFGPRNLPGARLSLPARLHGPVLRPLLLFEQGIASRLKRHFCKWYLDWFFTQTITAATKYKLKTDQSCAGKTALPFIRCLICVHMLKYLGLRIYHGRANYTTPIPSGKKYCRPIRWQNGYIQSILVFKWFSKI